jgi:hypothetical protein
MSFLRAMNTQALYWTLTLLCFFALLPGTGCKSSKHTWNPRLRQIDEMLDAQLPKGSSMARVNFFLNSRGHPLENSKDKHAIVAVIRHIDVETLQPTTARVTFHFDANERLTTYDLVLAPDAPPGS